MAQPELRYRQRCGVNLEHGDGLQTPAKAMKHPGAEQDPGADGQDGSDPGSRNEDGIAVFGMLLCQSGLALLSPAFQSLCDVSHGRPPFTYIDERCN